MMYYFPEILLCGIVFLLLVIAAKPRPDVQKQTVQDSKTLIALYRQHLRQSPEQKNELDYRLYHALKALKAATPAPTKTGLPLWAYPAVGFILSAAFFLWKNDSGAPYHAWLNIVRPLQPALLRSQYLDDFSALQNTNPLLYCQALQQQIQRKEKRQLNALGHCYTAYKDYPAAAAVYAYLHRLYPDDTQAAFNYAESTLFARPDQGMSREIEQILTAQADADPLAKILLAAGYTQNGQKDRARPLWIALRRELSPQNPLYHLIPRTEKDTPAPAAGTTITVSLALELLQQLPPQARLFITASPPGQRLPVAVKVLKPAANQTVTLTDSDSMTGAKLSQYSRLTYRAILSASGNVSGKRLAETQSNADNHATLTLKLP